MKKVLLLLGVTGVLCMATGVLIGSSEFSATHTFTVIPILFYICGAALVSGAMEMHREERGKKRALLPFSILLFAAIAAIPIAFGGEKAHSSLLLATSMIAVCGFLSLAALLLIHLLVSKKKKTP